MKRQETAQTIAEPILADAAEAMHTEGLAAHEIGQTLILCGIGMLARSLGPDGAGNALQEVADATSRWLSDAAETVRTSQH